MMIEARERTMHWTRTPSSLCIQGVPTAEPGTNLTRPQYQPIEAKRLVDDNGKGTSGRGRFSGDPPLDHVVVTDFPCSELPL